MTIAEVAAERDGDRDRQSYSSQRCGSTSPVVPAPSA
jgi:hypothetical protein